MSTAEHGALAPDAVLWESGDGIGRITLNRPDAANAITPEQRNRLIDVLAEAADDPAVRVVLLTSTGKHFCAGADVERIGSVGESARRVGGGSRLIRNGAQKLINSVLDCDKPVICVVQGTAAGLGAHLAYASDLVVASEQATFIESFVRRGLVVDAGGAYLLPRLIGLQRAKELALLGDRLSATDAAALGLVNRVVPAEALETTALELARRLASGPTSAIALTKRLFNTSLDADRQRSFELEAAAQEMQTHSEDAAEGVKSFLERRDPTYTGY